MESRRQEMVSSRANTLYIGGGTPSQIPAHLLQCMICRLQEIVPLEANAEVTIEANPDDISEDWVAALKETPVNRISMGVQSLDDDMLKVLNRRHNSAQVYEAMELLGRNGYRNVSLDLIYGLPGQTLEMWQRDVDGILDMEATHLSAYSLQYEEGTRLWKLREEGRVTECDEEESYRMYCYLLDATCRQGMEHYEISNFALPGYRARHNSGYWRDDPYVGLGPGAHSYDGNNHRSYNVPDLGAYIDAYSNRTVPVGSVVNHEFLTEEERYDEMIMKRLRTCEGLDLSELSPQRRDYALKMARQHIESGMLVRNDMILRLSREGIFVSNDIMSDMML